MQALALYDFVGNPENDEISFNAGDTIAVTNTDADDGWWEGIGSDGRAGFFPELYVEILPPIINNSVNSDQNIKLSNSSGKISYESPKDRLPTPPMKNEIPLPPQIPPPPTLSIDVRPPLRKMSVINSDIVDKENQNIFDSVSQTSTLTESEHMKSLANSIDSMSIRSPISASSPVLRRSFNRFSHFVASGAETFILNKNIDEDYQNFDRKTNIVNSRDGPKWQTISDEDKYVVEIIGHDLKTKFAGTKKFTVFHIHELKTDTTVFRRFKHFEWLHEILSQQFSVVCLPILPEKPSTGRFSEEFIENRRRCLERYLKRLIRHPLIRESTVLHFFLTCVDERAWKLGKRASERDQLQGAKLLETIEVLNSGVAEDGGSAEAQLFQRWSRALQINNQAVADASNGFLMAGQTFHKIYTRFSFALNRMLSGTEKPKNCDASSPLVWCWKPGCETCAALTQKIDTVVRVMKEVSLYWEVNARKSCIPVLEQLFEYHGLIDSMQDAVELQEKTALRYRDLTKSTRSELSEYQLGKVETVLNVAFAEMNRFHDEKNVDFDKMMSSFVSNQIEFHEKMLEKLREAKASF